ncbi:hypothetical protein Kisp02_57150 [Kineosporia sp. NBRC 101731]|nr:hypothetical protein Kisp02_57150 [Kineosporia sp. NBRC 101731]
MVPLVAVQPQRTGQRGEQLRRGLRATGLFQTHVVVGRHPGQQGYLLPAQTRSTAVRPGAQTYVAGLEAVATATQKVSQILPVDMHRCILPRPAPTEPRITNPRQNAPLCKRLAGHQHGKPRAGRPGIHDEGSP